MDNKSKEHIIKVLIKSSFPAILLLALSLPSTFGQDTIVNHYSRILSVENKDTTDFFDSVIVDSAVLFHPGDIAMFYQVKGLEIYPPGHPNEGKVNRGVGNPNTGIYTFIRVYDVAGSAVIFSTYLPKMKAPNPGEVNQLITVPPIEEQFSIPKTITCSPWDSAKGTGGVVAIIAASKITLNTDIDVSGQGFAGGDTTLFGGDCSRVTGSFHFENDRDSSGRKGEGAVLSNYPYKRGRQQLANAGGGGNGKFAGGAGGGNRGGGGTGGYPSDACGNNDPANLARGGYIDADLYTNVTELKNRIYFGGGGGAGNQGEGRSGTRGGNGGGIIILVTDTLESQNASLLAAGESVTGIATAGAGGGGGGGVIVVDANVITGNLAMDVSGGDGGNTNYATDRSGPGGLGGAGVIWHNGPSLPGGVSSDISEGSRGLWNNSSNHGTSSTGGGDEGAVLNNLILPMRGFTFNVASGTQTICQGDTPEPIVASQPKGDLPANFQYEWLARTNGSGWAPAAGINNQKDYAPGPLFDTTYYKRVVTPTDTMNRDTSGVVSIYVHDTISNNVISPDDIICWNVQPDTMTGTIPVGGDRMYYYYSWEYRSGAGVWTSSPEDTLAGYRYSGGLQETTYFRRKVTSGACKHYSDSLTIEVLDTIAGNLITDNQLICQYTAADSLFGETPSGGDNTYAYSWQLRYGSTGWVEQGTDMHFAPGHLDTATIHYYRRVASSGGPGQDACVDASNVLTIQVQPKISNNLLEPLDTLVCEGTDPGSIRPALDIGGGDGLVYAYIWEESLNQADWTASAGGTEAAYAPAPLSDTTWFRRIVHSGECRDTSASALINVHPGILNNLVTDHDTVCYNTQPLPFTQDGDPVSGGTGMYTYHWKSRSGTTGWEDASGVNDQSGYQASLLTDTTDFSRVVSSGVCVDTSNILSVVVQDDIQQNIINGDLPMAEACENIGDSITGTGSLELTGGDETLFSYRWEKFNTVSQGWEDAPVDNSPNTDSTYITEDMTVKSYYRRHVWSGACHDVTDSVTLNVNPRPTITFQSVDQLVECYDGINPVMFSIPVQLTGTPPFEVRYNKLENDSAGTSVASGGSFTVPLYSASITDYTITITDLIDHNICFSYPDALPASTPTARISRKPEPLLLLAADSVCGPTLTVTARNPISTTATGWWSSTDQAFSFEDSTSSETEMSTDLVGKDKAETILRWSELNGSCLPEYSDTLVVLFEEPEPAAVEEGFEDYILYFAPHTQLRAVPATAGQGTWTHVSGNAQMDENDSHNPNVYVSFGDSDLDKGDFNEFLWTVENVKCPATSATSRIERRDIARYTAFSPNYDDINDRFVLDGLDFADEFTMSIFTRQGVRIHLIEKSPGVDFTEDLWWDGRLDSGEEAEDGTYFYVLEVKYAGQTYGYKGYVELVRKKE